MIGFTSKTWRAFATADLDFVHPDCKFRPENKAKDNSLLPKPRLSNVNLLLGNNAAGKSTVLRSIAAACFGPAAADLLRNDSTIVRFGETTARIFGNLRLHAQDGRAETMLESDIEITRRGERLTVTLGQPDKEHLWEPIYESSNDALFIVGYGATHESSVSTFMIRARVKAKAVRDQRVQSLFQESFSLVPVSAWFQPLSSSHPERYAEIVNLINQLLPSGEFLFAGDQRRGSELAFDRGGTLIPFQSMSDGYRGFIGWVTDFLYHLTRGMPPKRKVADVRGIVLVDEIDLLLHPLWQMHVIEQVSRAFPHIQFIFTSHSPLIAGSLEWMNILTLKGDAKTNRTTVERLKEGIHGLDADQILLTDFFGLRTTRGPGKVSELEELRRKARHGDRESAKDHPCHEPRDGGESVIRRPITSRRAPGTYSQAQADMACSCRDCAGRTSGKSDRGELRENMERDQAGLRQPPDLQVHLLREAP